LNLAGSKLVRIPGGALRAAATLVWLMIGVNGAPAAELVMLERTGCIWCERWHAEIGPVYPKTDEAGVAPLRRVDLDGEWPADLSNIRKDHFTPTFVLIENGVEIDRLRGYSGEEFFWFLIDEMLKKLPEKNGTTG
jgi:hypothetical protein